MSSICIIDTSVFCNILKVPMKSQQYDETVQLFAEYMELDYTFLLPMATIYETGNHIAQNGDGEIRRKRAELFVSLVRDAFVGRTEEKPRWVSTPLDNSQEFMDWLAQFPDQAMSGTGLGDLSIIKVFERQCELHNMRHVFIWSYDNHLRAYSREI